MARRVIAALLLSALGAGLAAAQHHAPGNIAAAPLPAPTLRGIGDSHLTITTRSAPAQAFFDQGLNLLHCFWDYEAYRSFKTALAHDPTSAMSWWGLYMSLNYNSEEMAAERREALAKAIALAPTAGDHERRYIRALEHLNAHSGESGKAQYIQEMEALAKAYPDDLEARLFLVKFLLTETGGYFTDATVRGERRDAIARAKTILAPLLDEHPDSVGVNHYWVHAHEYDDDPTPALAAAEKLPQLAPGSGHILHMPGHLYYKLGRYEEARASFLAALAFDEKYLAKHEVAPVDDWNYVHNLDYLVADCAEGGRLEEGLRYARRLQEITFSRPRADAVGAGFILYGGQTSPARLLLRYAAFDQAATALEAILSEPAMARAGRSTDYHRGLLLYARGMSHAKRGEVEPATEAFQQLVALDRDLRGEQGALGSDWYFDASRRILAIATKELGGTLLSVQGQHALAIGELQRAVAEEAALGYSEPPYYARPVLESLAEALMRAQRFAEARKAYQQELKQRPRNGHAWFGIANTYVSEGDTEHARAAMRKLLEVWSHAEPDLPMIQATKRWLAASS